MNLLTAVQQVQDACGEPAATTVQGVTVGSLDYRFLQFVLRALTDAQSWADWPWMRQTLAVTAGAQAFQFTLPATVTQLIAVSYNGVPLNTANTYEDLMYAFPTSFPGGVSGPPLYACLDGVNTLVLYPTPTDVAPETLISVRAFAAPTPPALDADVLPGTDAFQNAVVRLATALAIREHFGDYTDASRVEAEAMAKLQRAHTAARKTGAAKRLRF